MRRIHLVKVEQEGEVEIVHQPEVYVARECRFGHRWAKWVPRSHQAKAEAAPCPICEEAGEGRKSA